MGEQGVSVRRHTAASGTLRENEVSRARRSSSVVVGLGWELAARAGKEMRSSCRESQDARTEGMGER